MAFIDRMSGQDYIDKTREYLNYLEEHLENVRKAFQEVSEACDGMMWVGDDCSWHTLRQQVVEHDVSKFSVEEFVAYREKFFPVLTTSLVRFHTDFDAAWENHKKENNHHHETAKNYLDIVHMVIDWTAMGYKFGDTAKQYYEANKDKINLSDEYIEFMYEMFGKINAYKSN